MTRRRRDEVTYDKDGVPVDAWRCHFQVTDKTMLFPRRCRKVRKRGVAWCEIHDRPEYRAPYLGESRITVDEVDDLAVEVAEKLDRIARFAARVANVK